MATDAGKQAAAEAALGHVEAGMTLGLGTGSTAALMVEALGARVAAGLEVRGVATSEATARQAAALGIPMVGLGEAGRIDLTIDGADEVDPALRLIKGGGGAHLREKMVAAASARMIVVADASKEVPVLGRFPLPVEIVRFGWERTAAAIAETLAGAAVARRDLGRRMAGGAPFETDEGHFILDLSLGRIDAPEALDTALGAIPGVVETGLFLGLADRALIGLPDGTVRVLSA